MIEKIPNMGGENNHGKGGDIIHTIEKNVNKVIDFNDKFPRCIANDNEFFCIENAIKHLYELYPGKSNYEILEWLLTFSENKKLFNRITDIVDELARRVYRSSKKTPKPSKFNTAIHTTETGRYAYSRSGD